MKCSVYIFWSILVYSVLQVLLFPYYISVRIIHPVLKWKSPILLLYCCLFLPSILLLFALNIRCSNIGYIYTCNCYILLMNWPLYQYIVTFFVSSDWFCLKVYYMWYNCYYSCSLLVTICMEYLFPSLYFQLVRILKVKVNLLWATYC